VCCRPAPCGQIRAAERIRTSTEWLLAPSTLPLVYGGIANVSCPRRDSNPHGSDSEADDSAVGLRGRKGAWRHHEPVVCHELAIPNRARESSSGGPDVDSDITGRWWMRSGTGSWGQAVGVTGLAPAATRSRTAQSSIEIHPGSGRWDSHPLRQGSRPCASVTSASTTVRSEGIAPSSLGYQPRALLLSYKRELHTHKLVRAACAPAISADPESAGSRAWRTSRRRRAPRPG
jgi:hypothetical protein